MTASLTFFRWRWLAAAIVLLLPAAARADDAEKQYITIDGPKTAPLPLAVEDARGPTGPVRTFDETLRNDLRLTGLFNVLDPRSFLADEAKEGTTAATINFAMWTEVGANYLAKARLTANGGSLNAELWLFDVVGKTESLHFTDSAGPYEAALLAHRWADKLYGHFTGIKGFFQTRIAFVRKTRAGKEIWVADFDGHNAFSLTPGGGLNLLPAWSRDGRDVIFTSYRRGSPMLYIADANTRHIRALPFRGELETGAAYNPRDGRIAFTMSIRGNSDIYVMNPDGTGLRRLTTDREMDISPTWSPDGQHIAFVSLRAGTPQIFIMNADGSGVHRLTFVGHYNQTPCWSPRGDVIVYTARDERHIFDIFTIDVDTGQIKRLTQDEGDNSDPTFSPNGGNIIFSSTRGGRQRLWIMSVDGSNQLPLALDATATSPAWGPWRN